MTTHPTTPPPLQPYPGLPLTLTDVGEGRPVLLLHGGAGPASMTAIADHFTPTRRVLTPTHPGWNDAPRPDWFTGVDGLVETYLDLLDDLRLHDVLVLGSSFGGWLAAEMAVRDRGRRRIGQLVLVGAIGPEVPGHAVRMPTPAPGVPGPSPEAIRTMLAYTGPALADPKLLHRLARVTVPTLAVWGENDAVVTPDFGRAYAGAIPDARFEVIPGAGHLPWQEAPDTVLSVIDAFVTAGTADSRSSERL
ncbi:alpha/beta fold hydrolase [Streptomyces sp. NPDC007983]|uniref:alpha/beta fold hydrolase n=1 Tax=Streptomyces sp. NPDC007983 TaxID=3364800 RepID=UPI0036E9E7F8